MKSSMHIFEVIMNMNRLTHVYKSFHSYRLFGIIARVNQDGKQIHVCYVFEAETSGKAVS